MKILMWMKKIAFSNIFQMKRLKSGKKNKFWAKVSSGAYESPPQTKLRDDALGCRRSK